MYVVFLYKFVLFVNIYIYLFDPAASALTAHQVKIKKNSWFMCKEKLLNLPCLASALPWIKKKEPTYLKFHISSFFVVRHLSLSLLVGWVFLVCLVFSRVVVWCGVDFKFHFILFSAGALYFTASVKWMVYDMTGKKKLRS